MEKICTRHGDSRQVVRKQFCHGEILTFFQSERRGKLMMALGKLFEKIT